MAHYEITPTPRGLHIKVDDVEGKEGELLSALQECQEGRCACPTAEYHKLEKMQVSGEPGTVEIELQTKSGETLATEAVQRCLDYTVTRLGDSA